MPGVLCEERRNWGRHCDSLLIVPLCAKQSWLMRLSHMQRSRAQNFEGEANNEQLDEDIQGSD